MGGIGRVYGCIGWYASVRPALLIYSMLSLYISAHHHLHLLILAAVTICLIGQCDIGLSTYTTLRYELLFDA